MSEALRSMTGFATAQGRLPDGAPVVLTIKSVNHRFLDLHFRLPGGSEAMEAEMRRLLKEGAARGHVELTLELSRQPTAGTQVNSELLLSYAAAWRSAAEQLGLTEPPEIATLMRLPGVVTAEQRAVRPAAGELAEAVLPLAREVIAAWNAERAREAAELGQALRAGLRRMLEASEEISRLREGVREQLVERLRARLKSLLTEEAISEERLLLEAGLLADRSDVEEEAIRLRAHVEQAEALLRGGGAVGKQLDFLLQEMNREANTTLSKTGSAAGPDSLRLTTLGLALKKEIEQIREQVQNLE